MSKGLRTLGRLARQALAEAESTSFGSQQLRQASTEAAQSAPPAAAARYSPKQFSKAKPSDKSATWIPKNPFIEAWVYRRDKYEKEFSWTFRNTVETGYYLVGLTVGFYAFSVWTIRHSDARNHYPKRDMLLAPSKTGFYLPDEREWY